MRFSAPRRRAGYTSLAVVAVATVLLAVTAVVWDRSGTSRPAAVHMNKQQIVRTYPSASADGGLSQVGPLFPHGLTQNHTCTASVVASTSGNTILTAAHCVSGSVRGMLFVPAYHDGSTPNGVWTVTGAYVTSRWLTEQAPSDDIAVLTVADRTVDGRRVTLASVTGAEVVGTTPTVGTSIRVEAYNDGIDDEPQTCTTALTIVHGHPTFHCHGFVGGSSGSPWLAGPATSPVVVGVIGGRHQGGCTEYTSHSAYFGPDVASLVTRAAKGGASDTPPVAGSSNCPSTASSSS